MGVRGTTLALVAGLVAIGLFAASPFLSKQLVGTGEAFNYSLSIADSLEQMRDGVMPPLAGQTQYAFNGRIHPLRTAPYLYYVAAVLDQATRHRLTAWQLQNLSLVLSLVGAGLACYLGLRRGVDCPRMPSFLLSGAYVLAPALLGAAHSFDLFMTVHVAVFVPLAVGACMRGILKPSFSADAWLAAALGAAWLAHPPVALWLTAGVVFVRVAAFARQPTWRVLASGTCAVALAAGLSLFVFASASSLDSSTEVIAAKGAGSGIPALIMANLRGSFPDSILPVSRGAGSLGSLQFGYVAWILLALTVACLARSRRRREGDKGMIWFAAWSLLVFAVLLLVLALPVPGLTFLLWRHVPGVALELTTIWPMQRLYLVAVAFTLFGAALVLPRAWGEMKHPRWAGPLAVLLAAGWCLYQAQAYVERGYHDRRPPEVTQSIYRPSNLDLTVTSYAYVGVPPTYVSGVMDPQFEFRLLKNGTEEIGSNLASAVATAPAVEHEVLRLYPHAFITLAPGKRYVLTFGFLTPPKQGLVEFTGPLIHRYYSLPSSGATFGFGMNDGQRRSLPIWTDGSRPERVEIRLDVPELNTAAGRITNFADLTLQEVQPQKLPIRLESLVPMRFEVDAPQAGLTVETPRRFIPGYEAIVNGHRVTPLMSPFRQVMVPVPRGRSVVELQCKGPPFVRFAFWLTAACWAGFLLWRLTGSWTPADPLALIARPSARALRFGARHWIVAALALATAAAGLVEAKRFEARRAYLRAVGPVRIDFVLPYGQAGYSQPLLTTGKVGAGAVVFVHLIDESHVWVGADVWGSFYKSGPLELDFSQVHNLVVSDSALYPADHPTVKALNPGEAEQLRGELRVELDGATVIHEKCYAYETLPSEILVGATPFVSMSNPKFLGEVESVQRLAIPRTLSLPAGRHVHLDVRFPKGREGSSEPLLSVSTGGSVCACYVTYLSENRVRFASWSPGLGILGSAEVSYDPRQVHELDFTPGQANDRTLGLDVACRFDGKRLFGRKPVHFPTVPSVTVSAFNAADAPGVQSRFTGPECDVSLVKGVTGAGVVETFGPVHMIVLLPKGKEGRHEPLLTTGHAGAADMIYVMYEDAGHVRIGYDHWGVGGATSPPIAVDFRLPHEIWITMASLNPVAGQGPATQTTVILDGQAVISSAITPYPSLKTEVTVSKNRVGASTADPDFSGAVQFDERTGAVRAPAPRS